MDALHLDAVVLGYGGKSVVSELSFALAPGEIGCLLGGSGCGKTTVLRAIAGFEPLQGGCIALNGHWVADANWQLAPERRQIGMVFQDYALFPHMTVANNVGFGLREWSSVDKGRRIDEMLELVGLSDAGKRYPHQLSGGQQQRVALARALAPGPTILLMDEPFSNLDVELRERLSIDVHNILKETGTTGLLVTHNQQEAFAMADRVGVMVDGQLQQWASPYALYHEPATRHIATFVGDGVFLPAWVSGQNCVSFELGELCRIQPLDVAMDSDVDVLIRPDDIQHDDSSPVRAKVLERVFRGAAFLYTLELPSGDRVLSLVPSHHNHAVGEMIGIQLEIDHLVAFPKG
ncbi:MAG: Ferric iron ABC transporter ATP-binding protein [Fluviibacter phosphoraccumulans EoVTN8]